MVGNMGSEITLSDFVVGLCSFLAVRLVMSYFIFLRVGFLCCSLGNSNTYTEESMN